MEENSNSIGIQEGSDSRSLAQRLNNEIESFDPAHPKLSKQAQIDIRNAANSGDRDLFHLACLLAYTATYNHFKALAVHLMPEDIMTMKRTSSSAKPGVAIMEEGDVMDAFYEAICECIANYDGVHSLYTYLEPFTRRKILQVKKDGTGETRSKHYLDAKASLKKAKADLATMGYDNPTTMDILNHIRRTDPNNKISARTIARLTESDMSVISLDEITEKGYITPDVLGKETDPVKMIIEAEREKEFQEIIRGLAPRYRLLVELEITHMRQTESDALPSAETMRRLLSQEYPLISKDDAERWQKAAHNQLRRSVERSRRRSDEGENRMMRSSFVDRRTMVEDEQAILIAIEEDIDLINPGRPSDGYKEPQKSIF